ncbi:hypothetical protein [Pararhodobacter aggregans]|uniref:Tryptophan-rich sensory protein n=1 Tax=Pararhodobacter aggregans TaxID=404875 RepID=A0A2T7UQI1_9RHOB|nr:hypothetical protein [Pararhodobacter aggregans]PTX01588.1 hypothetical protein C8N33_107154 [Pararhodobacter aggregans]PVE46851.1 hypothetical protein DDE23_14300 [Pararhodobacter aggregans]
MTRLIPALLLLAAILFAASPLFVTSFAGFDPALFPVPQDNPPVQPAPYTFAIWGLLYTWLIVSSAFGLWKRAGDPAWQPARPWLLASLGLGIFWLPVAERSVIAATVLIWAMLALALVALFRTRRHDRWWFQAPVATYAGWLLAASSVSVGLILAGWGVMEATPAALVALALALVLGLTVQWKVLRAPGLGLALIWALIGVAVNNSSPLNMPVLGLALLGVVAFVVMLALGRRQRRKGA